ncbi:glycosyltransferase family 2 protein [Anabaena sphaerica FACHB-251]|uniref:Glycosyltransferase family 2 protein n=1 Tax=Anabaena sphaerica FACHB-251 TaxID=2692883 RepID=A0A926WJV3_9NOST|nr:glycosyltransferase family 2 protein [Anabaena sphaerica]MBD2295929.1 glycosyltransferase family 2 protein [Anabaena sphaerica FACHB-251]
MNRSNLAIIMTCHNRKEITLACLQELYQQNVKVDVYLVDDGSSDGTSNSVRDSYPEVNILQGNGNLFWGGGMRLAFGEALKQEYEFYIWLNDDTMLTPDAINKLLQIHNHLAQQGHRDTIIVGSTQDPITGSATYGGAVRSKHWYSNKFEFVAPGEEPQQCDTMYGNCVLIPNSVAQKVGNLDPAFIHTFGDLDYGLRAKKLGCTVWTAPGYIGSCSKNSVRDSWADTKLPIHKRLQKVTQIKGFPVRAWTIFTRRHSGPFWYLYWFLPYIRAIIGYKNLQVSATFAED